jgi:hypothetical protein
VQLRRSIVDLIIVANSDINKLFLFIFTHALCVCVVSMLS